MKQRLFVVLMMIMAAVPCSGCSYSELDNQIQDNVQQQMDSGVDGYTSEGRAYVEVPPQQEDDIEYKGIGESFPAYRKYTVSGEEVIEKGTDGLTYTLRGVKSYNSINDSDVDMYGSILGDDDWNERNGFVLLDIRATYSAPTDGRDEIIADANELSGTYLEKGLEGQLPDGLIPTLGYFSLRPKEDDPNLDYQHQAYSYIIRDGETIDFQIGLFCDREYIDSKNVYLELNEIPWMEDGEASGDMTRKLFVLFPEGGE